MSGSGAGLVLLGLALAGAYAARQHLLLHLFQQEHYEPARLRVWVERRGEALPVPALAAGLAFVGLATALYAVEEWACAAVLLAGGAALVAFAGRTFRRPVVKPLVFTDRAKRLYMAALAPFALVLAALVAVALTDPPAAVFALVLALALLSLLAAPALLIAANRAMAPLQRRINERFLAQARERLASWRPLVVGITGSYGKTSTKFCIGGALGADRPTLVTPESYNSYLGVTRTINELLEESHRAFVVEMGAYRRGDIAELCELVKPSIGVLTAIGPVHLERFGSLDAIAEAKAEIMESLPPEGHFVTNADDERCRAVAARAHVPVTLFSLEDESAPVRASGIELSGGRMSFTLHMDGGEQRVTSNLLGRHNVRNLLAAAAVARAAGVAPETIARGLAEVEAPPHRLQPIQNRQAGIVVIDDAYNSNPAGASAALDVLREHDARRRLLVTPGMVELGEVEEEENRAFGRAAASVCDVVILVGPRRTRPIHEGLVAGGFDEGAIHVVRDIGEATTTLAGLTRSGDVVLFENDLPDLYAEDDGAARAAA